MKIDTLRTIATPIQKEDFSDIIGMYFEPGSSKFIKPLLNKTLDEYNSFLENRLKQSEESVCFWTVRSPDSNELMGTINLNYLDAIKGYHIGCHLRKKYWGMGYATELLMELLKFGLETRNLKEIYGIVEKGHHVSKKMLLKIGLKYEKDFELEGCILEQYLYRNI